MPSVYDLKPRFQQLLRPLMVQLAQAGMRPNHVTVLGVAISLGVGAAIAWRADERWPLLLLPAALFVRMALNAIDGLMARSLNMTSRLGAVLNELGDVISDTALYLPLARVPGISATLIVAIVVLAIISEMTGVVAVQIGATRRYDGPMGKSDRAFVFGVLGLALGIGLPAGWWIGVVLTIVLMLLIVTIANRARRALAEGGR